jgi:hypothetical protein
MSPAQALVIDNEFEVTCDDKVEFVLSMGRLRVMAGEPRGVGRKTMESNEKQKSPLSEAGSFLICLTGLPSTNRTCDLRLRRPLLVGLHPLRDAALYPPEHT